METQEQKKGCCEGKENCNHEQYNCCGHWRNCRMMKIILGIIILIIAFCLGSQWGEMKCDHRGDRYERGNMMNWKTDRFDNRISPTEKEVTILPAPVTTTLE